MKSLEKLMIEYLDYYNNRRIKAKLKGLLPAIHRQQALSAAWTIFTSEYCLTFWGHFTRIPSSEYLRDGSIPVIDQSSDFIAGYTNNPDSVLKSKSGYIVFGDHTRIVKYIRFPFARGADGTQVLKSNNPCIPEELFYQMIKSIDLSNYGYARHFKFLKDMISAY